VCVVVICQTYEAACCDDMLTWSMSGRSYEPCNPAICSGNVGLQCGITEPGARLQYGTCSRTMTNRALNPAYYTCRPPAHPADYLGLLSPALAYIYI